MVGIPVAARAYIAGAVVCAAGCALPAFGPGAGTPWWPLALLAALYAVSEWPARRSRLGGVVGAGSFLSVLLAAALLLPPAAAALVAVPGALISRVERGPAPPRRIWRAARLALAVWAAAHAALLLDGPAAVAASDFPYALVPAGAAALAFCLVLTALDGGILAAAEPVPLRGAWHGLLPRALAPHAVHGLAGLMMAVLWRSPYGWPAALFVLLPMCISCWMYAQYHRERAAHQATIRALVQAVDIKDAYTRGHSERVGRASVLIGRELGMDEARLDVIRFAGILHDVGKLGVPTRVLRKDGPLTPEERRVIELHPEYGHEIVRGIGFLGEARAAILHHHERMDGSGYPYGLSGDRIPEAARVVAVADAFDAMTSTRSYRRARPVATAVAELERCAGRQFDPRMVRALVRALDRHGWQTAVTADENGPAATGTGTGTGTPPADARPVPPARSRGSVPVGRRPRPGRGHGQAWGGAR
ncbi:HD-GYP domain-containing protein [Streptomyces lavendofoliae]|uniref:Metal-dependent phosphohydrolase n=1 Tax=Streptomyces lavendofoliae TaxID=67314 RepID=A0A918I1C3_9ACTN|nr:HD-GYP domain-containing protein [Streptomyces lavendofoliae]GGU53353.1 metal-dependent phosphohydrolase [Streptomyces lavendofoliae]